jgi:alpha-beta hydrolase superfamily lysophospholipase
MASGLSTENDARATPVEPSVPTAGKRKALFGVRLLAVLVALFLLISAAAVWYLSNQIRGAVLEVGPPSKTDNVRVVSSTASSVTLTATGATPDALVTDKVYGMVWSTGSGQLRALQAKRGERVTRVLRLLEGDRPVPGETARLTRDAYPRSPGGALGFPARQVFYRAPRARFPAYFASGRGTTWAVLVHGRGATRSEMFRLMRVSVGLGFPSLDIAYRRDAESGGGLARFGQDEWRDLQAAVQYALENGARRVVLFGASMGGAISAAFLERSPLAGRVSALVLDAPMLDFAAMVHSGAASRRLPVVGTPIPGVWVSGATSLAGARFGLDLDLVDYLDDTSWLRVPTLAFYGTQDQKTPPSLTIRLARAHPRLVSAVAVAGADHVESWNVDPAAYEAHVREFLRPLAVAER